MVILLENCDEVRCAHSQFALVCAGKSLSGPEVRELDIAVGFGLQNADPCTAKDCMWPKSKDGTVYVPYTISDLYCKQIVIVASMLSDCFVYFSLVTYGYGGILCFLLPSL